MDAKNSPHVREKNKQILSSFCEAVTQEVAFKAAYACYETIQAKENEKRVNLVDQFKSIIVVSRCNISVCGQIYISNITVMQDAVTKLYRCVVEIKIKAEFKDRQGLTHDY